MPDLTPDGERELAAVDDALAGRRVDPDLADLAELALLLRDERPAARRRLRAPASTAAPRAAFPRGVARRPRVRSALRPRGTAGWRPRSARRDGRS